MAPCVRKKNPGERDYETIYFFPRPVWPRTLTTIVQTQGRRNFNDNRGNAPKLSKSPSDVIFRLFVFRLNENRVGVIELDQLAQIHIGGVVGHPRGLLHVVGDDEDGDFFL